MVALVIISLLIFIFIFLANRDCEVVIATTKGILFGFAYNAEVFDGYKAHTFQCCVFFVVLNLIWDTNEQ